MFGIGLPEFILIMALALIVVGPDKLPGLAKTVAKQILELKKAAGELQDSLQEEIAEEKESFKELSSSLNDVDLSLNDLDSANKNGDHKAAAADAADEAQGDACPQDTATAAYSKAALDTASTTEARREESATASSEAPEAGSSAAAEGKEPASKA